MFRCKRCFKNSKEYWRFIINLIKLININVKTFLLFGIHNVLLFLPLTNEVRGKVMFLHLCVILFMGEVGLPNPPPMQISHGLGRPSRCRPPPRVEPTPPDAGPQGWTDPPDAYPPGVGQTPQMQTPLGLGRPPGLGKPLGCRPPPEAWQTPSDADPPGLGRPPSWMQILPGFRPPPDTDPPPI